MMSVVWVGGDAEAVGNRGEWWGLQQAEIVVSRAGMCVVMVAGTGGWGRC